MGFSSFESWWLACLVECDYNTFQITLIFVVKIRIYLPSGKNTYILFRIYFYLNESLLAHENVLE